jgi:Glycosyltransferase family 87
LVDDQNLRTPNDHLGPKISRQNDGARGRGRSRDVLDLVGWALFILTVALIVVTSALYVVDFGAAPDDAQTYFAAGERLNAGHDLYALGPGDRRITPRVAGTSGGIPLLSPPLVAVAWRPLAALPNPIAVGIWWLLMTSVVALSAVAIVRRRPIVGGTSLAVVAAPLVWQIVGGNVNALLIGGAMVAWILVVRGRVAAGAAIIATLIVLKVIPLPLLAWVLAVDPRRATRGATVGGGLATAVSVAGAGFSAHLAYVNVVLTTGGSASEFSVGGWAHDYLGVPADQARLLPLVALLVGTSIAVLLRNRRGVAFASAVLAMTFGFGAVHYQTYALVLPIAAPFAWRYQRDLEPSVADEVRRQLRRRRPERVPKEEVLGQRSIVRDERPGSDERLDL